jgi:hypothetical protein
MPLRPTRVGLAPRSVLAVLVLTLCSALLLAAADPASAVTRKQAAKKALKSLGSAQGSGSVIVFGLSDPVRPGSRVTQSGSSKTVGKVGRERAFFFYEDSGPYLPYPHRGRVALVGSKSGKVKLSKTLRWAPLVNGKLPVFLKSRKRYESPEYRVFHRSSNAEPEAQGNDPFAPDVSLAAAPANQSPTANSQTVTVKQNSPKRITLTGSDPDGDLLVFEVTKDPNQPNQGTLSGQPPDLTYTPNFGRLGPDHFFFRVTDGESLPSKEAKVTINIVPRGIPSTVMTSLGCTAYTEQAPAVAVDGQVAVTDPDDAVLQGAQVRVATSFERGDDLLFTDQNGISGSYDDINGVLTLVGDSSVANYQAALRSVRYRNLSSGSPAASKGIEFMVDDAGGFSAPAVKQVCITTGDPGSNDKPTGESSEGAVSYVENDGPVQSDAGFVVGDPDSANLSGATVKFIPVTSQAGGGGEPGNPDEGGPSGDPVPGETIVSFDPVQDELAFTAQNGITGNYDDDTGVLTLTGTSSLENYEAAIRSVTYENVSDDPTTDPRRLEFQVTDNFGATSTPSRRDIFITAVNDAPVVTMSDGPTDYTENDPPTAVDASLTVGDADNERPPLDDMEGAVVQATAGWSESEDSLTFTEQGGITGAYDDGTGTITFSGTASVADYQDVLRSVQYENSSENPSSATRTFKFTVNDGEADSADTTKDVTVTPVNDAPVATTTGGDTAYTENATAVTVDGGVTVADVDDTNIESATVQISSGFQSGDDLVFVDQNGISGVYNTGTGVLSLTGSASLAIYETALGSIRFRSTNDDPVTSKTVEFVVDDGDLSSAAATKSIAVTPVNDPPVLDATDTALAYTEGDGAVPIDDAISVTDPDSDTLSGATITVSSGFDGAQDQLAFTSPNGIEGSLDESGDTMTLTGIASVADYEAAIRAVTFENTSQNPTTDTRTVTFKTNDGELDAAPDTREIAVTAVNDAPVVTTTDGPTQYTVGDPAVVIDSGVAVDDVDDANIESAQVVIAADDFETGDQLEWDEPDGSPIAVNPTTNGLSLTGSATVAEYQAALAQVRYNRIGEGTPSSPKTVEFTVSDGDLDSAVATKELDITTPPTGEAPVVTTSEGNTSYTLGDTAGVVVDNALTVTDADDTDLEGAQVQIEGFEPGDELIWSDQGAITGSFDSEVGVLPLLGTATVAEYETALRSIKFRHSGDNQSAFRSVAFKVNDGSFDSAFALKAIDLVAPAP